MRGLRFIVVVALALPMLVAACAEETPVGVSGEPPQHSLLGDLLGLTGLLNCTPLPADSVTQIVGPEGGSVHVGRHTLAVPPQALPGPTAITAVAPTDNHNRVVLGPEGLTFDVPAALTLSYSNCSHLALLVPRRVAYLSDDLQILEYLESLNDWSSQSVTASLDHFSNYAVAW